MDRLDVKPKVVVSRCLGFDECRYNGVSIHTPFIDKLGEYVEYATVCPEADIGLGVPRKPVRVVVEKKKRRLYQPATGKDYTGEMEDFVDGFLSSVGEVDGFILKSRSPSCGYKDVKEYVGFEPSGAIGGNPGFYGGEVVRRYGHLAVEDEGRLRNLRLRHHFLTKLFTRARFRKARESGEIRDLVDFHTSHKLIIQSYSQKILNQLGNITANREREPTHAFELYELSLAKAFEKPATIKSNINVLQHAFGYFKKELKKEEKEHFLELIEEYRDERVTISTLNILLESWNKRFDQKYLIRQYFFNPYPRVLNELDSLCVI